MMNVAPVVFLIPIITAALVLIWLLSWRRFRAQMTSLRKEMSQAGEALVVGPEVGLYYGSWGICVLKYPCAFALTDRRVVCRRPIGADISIPLSSVVGVSECKWFQGNYRGGRTFVVLELADGGPFGFIVKVPVRWHQEISSRIG